MWQAEVGGQWCGRCGEAIGAGTPRLSPISKFVNRGAKARVKRKGHGIGWGMPFLRARIHRQSDAAHRLT